MMKNLLLATLCLMALAIIIGCSSCQQDKPIENPKPAAQATCNFQEKLPKVSPDFKVEIDKLRQTATFTKAITAKDGQKIGHEMHLFRMVNEEKCEVREVYTEKEVNGEKLANLVGQGKSEFYRNDRLVYTDLALRNGAWRRTYDNVLDVPAKIPNWASRGGNDLYMTWVSSSDKNAARIPLWPSDAVWTKEADGTYTMLAGTASMKSPTHAPTNDELVLLLRMDKTGVVNNRGVLFPVGARTLAAYLNYLSNKEVDTWERDLAGDTDAAEEFFAGPIKLVGQKVKKHKGRAIQVAPLEKVWEIRHTETTAVDPVPDGFVPAIDVLPLLKQ